MQDGSQRTASDAEQRMGWLRRVTVPGRMWFTVKVLVPLFYRWNPRVFWTLWGGEKYQARINATGEGLHAAYLQAQQDIAAMLEGRAWKGLIEIGCGTGWNLVFLNERFRDRRFAGRDFSSSQLASAREWSPDNISFQQADARDLPDGDKSFDVVLTVTVLEHIPPAHIGAVVSELRRISSKWILIAEQDFIDTSFASAGPKTLGPVVYNHDYRRLIPGEGYKLVAHKVGRPDHRTSIDVFLFERNAV